MYTNPYRGRVCVYRQMLRSMSCWCLCVAAKGEVNICRVFLENFSGDQVGPRGHKKEAQPPISPGDTELI